MIFKEKARIFEERWENRENNLCTYGKISFLEIGGAEGQKYHILGKYSPLGKGGEGFWSLETGESILDEKIRSQVKHIF